MGGVVDAIGDVVGGVADVAGDVVGGVADVVGDVVETVVDNPELALLGGIFAAPYLAPELFYGAGIEQGWRSRNIRSRYSSCRKFRLYTRSRSRSIIF